MLFFNVILMSDRYRSVKKISLRAVDDADAQRRAMEYVRRYHVHGVTRFVIQRLGE